MGGDRLVIGNTSRLPRDGSSDGLSDRVLSRRATAHDATPIDLAPGQEKGGVDVALQPVPVVRVSGTVISVRRARSELVLRLLPRGSENLGVGSEQATALVSASGAFTFLASRPAATRSTRAERDAVQHRRHEGPSYAGHVSGVQGCIGAVRAGRCRTRHEALRRHRSRVGRLADRCRR
jgi:hypothetical protein